MKDIRLLCTECGKDHGRAEENEIKVISCTTCGNAEARAYETKESFMNRPHYYNTDSKGKQTIEQSEVIRSVPRKELKDEIKERGVEKLLSICCDYEESDLELLPKADYAEQLTSSSDNKERSFNGYIINVKQAIESKDTFGIDLDVLLEVASEMESDYLMAYPL